MRKICEQHGSKCDFGKYNSTIDFNSGINKTRNTESKLSRTFRSISLFTLAIALLLFMLLIAISPVFALQDLMALQGNVNDNGLPVNGNLLVTIWTQATGGSLIYNSSNDYNNAIVSGKFDIILGDGSQELVLEYGKNYYMDMSVNGQDLDFNGTERRIFQSNVGNVSGQHISANTINTTQIADSAITNQKISATAAIDKSKISLTGTWSEAEIPSLTSSWSGTLNASKIVSTNLLNVNSSIYAQYVGAFDANSISLKLDTSVFTAENISLWSSINNKLGVTDQRFNETTVMLSNDTKLNTKIDNLNSSIGSFYFSVNGNSLATNLSNLNSSLLSNDSSLNNRLVVLTSDNVTQFTAISNVATNLSNLNSSLLSNDTTLNTKIDNVNTSNNIQKLGFNTTVQLNTMFLNVNDTINTTNINATNTPLAGQVLTYAGSNDQFVWDDTRLLNYTTAIVQTTVATTYTLIPNLTIILRNASTYLINCYFLTYSAAVTTGEQFQINTTGTPTKVTWSYNTQVTATARTAFQGVSTTTNAFADTGSAGTNIRDIGQFSGYIVTGANPVVLTYEIRSEVGTSNAAIDIGSYCQYIRV